MWSEARADDREKTNDCGEDCPTVKTQDGVIESNWDEIVPNFEDMNLRPELLCGISASGFVKPSPIQQRAIIACIKGNDVIVEAESGTGKTVASIVAILQQIDTSLNECQALILVPTRELALQIQKVVLALGHCVNVQCHACIGGTNVHQEVHKLKLGVHIVVGTLGRLNYMIYRKALDMCLSRGSQGGQGLDYIKMCVLEGADALLKPRFKDMTDTVFKGLNQSIQVILLSKTELLEVSEEYVKIPIRIRVKKEEHTL